MYCKENHASQETIQVVTLFVQVNNKLCSSWVIKSDMMVTACKYSNSGAWATSSLQWNCANACSMSLNCSCTPPRSSAIYWIDSSNSRSFSHCSSLCWMPCSRWALRVVHLSSSSSSSSEFERSEHSEGLFNMRSSSSTSSGSTMELVSDSEGHLRSRSSRSWDAKRIKFRHPGRGDEPTPDRVHSHSFFSPPFVLSLISPSFVCLGFFDGTLDFKPECVLSFFGSTLFVGPNRDLSFLGGTLALLDRGTFYCWHRIVSSCFFFTLCTFQVSMVALFALGHKTVSVSFRHSFCMTQTHSWFLRRYACCSTIFV